MSLEQERTSRKVQQISAILQGRTLYEKQSLSQSIFETDLVIKMRFPLGQQNYLIDKGKYVNLDEFVADPDAHLAKAHRQAYQKLLIQKNTKRVRLDLNKSQKQKTIQLRNQVNYISVPDQQATQKKYQILLQNKTKQQIIFPCYLKCDDNQLDCFKLNYNTLIYVLRKKCGFQTVSYFVQRKSALGKSQAFVYILITQQTDVLLKSADHFGIKKEIDYSQIDLFLNQPVDSLQRPYQTSSNLITVQPAVLRRIVQEKKQQIQRAKRQAQVILPGQKPQITLKMDKKHSQNNLLNSTDKIQIKQEKKQKTPSQIQQQKHNHFGLGYNRLFLNLQSQQQKIQKNNNIRQLFKRIHRSMGDKIYKVSDFIINQQKMNQHEKNKLCDYLTQFFIKFDNIMQKDIHLSSQQNNFILDINRGKNHIKSTRQYILKIKRKQVFNLFNQLSKKYGFRSYQTPISYFPFILPSKRLSGMERYRGLLFYEEYRVSPFGDISFFTKMDRIKLAYFSLKQHLRVQNFNKIGCTLFTLHNDYQRYGDINNELSYKIPLHQTRDGRQLKGGLNGTNVADSWNPLTPWKVDVPTIRNYFGQNTIYQVYLKTHLIIYLLFITPLGIGTQIFQRYVIYKNIDYNSYMDRGFDPVHKQQLAFQLVYFTICIIIFAIFAQLWKNKEEQFIQNFVQNQTRTTFRYSYNGPYIRNNITDSMNQFKLTVDRKSIIIKALNLIFILILLGGQCGFFYGMRQFIIFLSAKIDPTGIYLISWPHIIGYGIYFVVNTIIYKLIIKNITQPMTGLQNIPTQDNHKRSVQSKRNLFLIGVQIIPILFFFIFQPLTDSSCYSSSCLFQFIQFVYTRYFIVLVFLVLKIVQFIIVYLDTRRKMRKLQANKAFDRFDQKLLQYMKYIEVESKKPQYQLGIQDVTQVLLHYGMFCTSMAFCPGLGLATLILQYLIQRIQIIVRNKRPIPKAQVIQYFSANFNTCMHLSILINMWIAFFNIQSIQYSIPNVIQFFIGSSPSYASMLLFKLILILIFIFIFELLTLVVRLIVSALSNKQLHSRKKLKYQKHLLQRNVSQKTKGHLCLQKINPYKTIFRTYHHQIIDNLKIKQKEKQKKKGNYVQQEEISEGLESQQSGDYLRNKKG